MFIYKGLIRKLEPHQIFLFGSNTQGRHGKGAAKTAMKFGAIYGQARGLQGQTYAIITKDLTKKNHPSVSIKFIIDQIIEFYQFALNNKNLQFLVAYSGIGENLNGYSNQEMANMFSFVKIPENIVFEENFFKLLKFK